jgi:hypothetical protein
MSKVSTQAARAQGKILEVLLMRGLSETEAKLINTMSEENLMSKIGLLFAENTGDTIGSFIVGIVFQHRNSVCVPQWFSENFREWLWKRYKERTITIDLTPRKLNEYCLPKNMNDSTIQKNAKSTPMSIEEYWLIRYLLIANPELGKQLLGYELKKDGPVYIMHLNFDDGTVVATNFYWDIDEWNSDVLN